ncbi:MAG: hypothetical protein KAJ19_26680 [Gammaproteobacteria bacterium]|nr:hypothetical protein [Gammaproteobacteria bacterium]
MDTLRRLFSSPLELIVLVSAIIVIHNVLARLQGTLGDLRRSLWHGQQVYNIATTIATVIISIALATILVRLL